MNSSGFVGEFTLSKRLLEQLRCGDDPQLDPVRLPAIDPSALQIPGLLSERELSSLREELDVQSWVPVGQNGILRDFRPGIDAVGSYRASAYTPELAAVLWRRLRPFFEPVRTMADDAATDFDGHRRWRPLGINPLLRFISYLPGGLLVPHYDAPYDGGDGTRTLVTVVVYLNRDEGVEGGATRFIADPQRALPPAERDYSDWTRLADDREIIASVAADPGSALLFDHRILHDSEPTSGAGQKLIVRTDIVYERVLDE